MGLKLYNTLTRRIEPFEPLRPPTVTIYMCGPTVYSYAHIGNFRTFLLSDLLRRYLTYRGHEVFLIMNLTDVDDRLIAQAAAAGLSLAEHTQPFVDAFFEDRDYLGLEPADVYPRATRSIPSMVELVETLLNRDLAYRSEDGSVYFAIERFPSYGRLTQLDRRELRVGARVDSDEYEKDDARDFALWKTASETDEEVGAAWDAPFGRGRPGWHLECSAMALAELRERFGIETLDIHAGGVDLRFPHHENEIAQSEGATGEPFARFWVHGEFLNVEGIKMSKRYGNFLTPRDLRENGIDPAAVRFLMFQTHYRQQLNFSDKGLEDAHEAGLRLREFRDRLLRAAGDAAAEPARVATDFERAFQDAMDDDLNAPKAIGVVFSFIKRANRALDAGEWTAEESAGALAVFDRTTGVLQIVPAARAVDEGFQSWVEGRIEARSQARAARDFATADAIRAELTAKGVELEDTPDGTRWRVD